MPGSTRNLQDEALRRLLSVARKLSASSDLHQILQVIIDAMRDLLDADRASVFEYDAEHEELFLAVSHDAKGIRFPVSAGLAGEAATTRKIVNVPDAHADPRFNADIDRQTGYHTRSLVSIPLEGYDGELVGVAQVLNKRGGPFNRVDEEIATALAAQAAVALKRGRMMEDRVVREKLERDLEVAREIQQGSFPSHIPTIAGFDIAAWSEPAEETGGDSYDVVAVGDDRVVLLLADATGHGIGPALAVTQVRSMLRMAVRMDASIEHVARHVNGQLAEDLPAGRFVTAWLAELDGSAGTLRSFSAGQGPLLHYTAADNEFTELDVDAMPLGIMPELDSHVRCCLHMKTGDILAAISDGIFEAMSGPGQLFGSERAQAVILANRDGSSAGILAAVRAAVDEFAAGRPPDDDRTMIIVKRTAG